MKTLLAYWVMMTYYEDIVGILGHDDFIVGILGHDDFMNRVKL